MCSSLMTCRFAVLSILYLATIRPLLHVRVVVVVVVVAAAAAAAAVAHSPPLVLS